MSANKEKIKNVLLNYWKDEIRKEQLLEDTLSMNPEFCSYLDELNSSDTISEYQLETYKKIMNQDFQ